MITEVTCPCTCHNVGSSLIHFDACCEGRCQGCGQNISSSISIHRRNCKQWLTWAKTQKRDALKQLGLHEDFVIAKGYETSRDPTHHWDDAVAADLGGIDHR